MKLHQKWKKKSMKYWQIGQIVYSHFLIEKWKVKTLGTITAHTNIEKLNERGKKRLNAKLERHLTRPHTLPHKVSAFIYILIGFHRFQSLFNSTLCMSHFLLYFFSSSKKLLVWQTSLKTECHSSENISPFKDF